jgi:2-polyprenyl-6-hydroxyphenyl methylase/3-demethylubiquinone-9 3-methyltransferase
MQFIELNPSWNESWKFSYKFDLLEVYGSRKSLGHSYAYQNRLKHTLDLVKTFVKPGAKILDVAAAQGNFSLILAEQGYEVTWNDLRSDLIDYVKLKHESGTIHYAPGDVFKINLENQYDMVLITEIIEHVAHPDQFLEQVSTLVKPGGYILMTTPNGEYFANKLPRFSDCPDPSVFEEMQFMPDADGHIFLLHLDEIADLAKKSSLLVKSSGFYTNTLTNGFFKTGFLLKIIPQFLINFIQSCTNRFPGLIKRKLHTGMSIVFQRSH